MRFKKGPKKYVNFLYIFFVSKPFLSLRFKFCKMRTHKNLSIDIWGFCRAHEYYKSRKFHQEISLTSGMALKNYVNVFFTFFLNSKIEICKAIFFLVLKSTDRSVNENVSLKPGHGFIYCPTFLSNSSATGLISAI